MTEVASAHFRSYFAHECMILPIKYGDPYMQNGRLSPLAIASGRGKVSETNDPGGWRISGVQHDVSSPILSLADCLCSLHPAHEYRQVVLGGDSARVI